MIKKLCAVVMLAQIVALSMAETPLTMILQTEDGAVAEIEAASLVMSVSGDKLVVTNGRNNLDFELSKLTKMYFAGDASGINMVTSDLNNEEANVYTVDGLYLGRYDSVASAKSELPRGVYLVKTSDGKTIKISVR